MSKVKPIRVLIIDDDPAYVEVLQRNANPYRILFEAASNLEDGVALYRKRGDRHFSGIILDVICLKTRVQKIPDPSFIIKAKEQFDQLAPALLKVILTGETGTAQGLKPFITGNTPLFQKNDSETEEMLQLLVSEAEKLPFVRFRKRYPDIFEIFDSGLLDSSVESRLISCLEKMEFTEQANIESILGNLRLIQESIYLALNKVDPEIVPTSCIDKKGPQCRSIMSHLRENVIERGKIIDRAGDTVYSFSSDYGNHVPNTRPQYSPTRYTAQSCIFAMFDLLLWYKEMVGGAKA